MLARCAGVVVLGCMLLPTLAFADPLPCTTDNLLAHKGLLESASTKLDDCNRGVLALGRWVECDLPAELPLTMPWVRECLSERLAANVARLDNLTDPRAADVAELRGEARRLGEMSDAFSFYIALMMVNLRLEYPEAASRVRQ